MSALELFFRFRHGVLLREVEFNHEPENLARAQVAAFVSCLSGSHGNGDTIARTGKLNFKLVGDEMASIDIPPFGKSGKRFFAMIDAMDAYERNGIIQHADSLLARCLSKRMRGDFYTPVQWVVQAHSAISSVLGPYWAERTVIWDASAGTGNLTASLNAARLIQTTLFATDLGMIEERGTNTNVAYRGQFDFLASPTNYPKEVHRVLETTGKAPIIMFNNPPFKTGGSFTNTQASGDTRGASVTAVGKDMTARGLRSDNLCMQFLWKITRLACGWSSRYPKRPVYNAIFLPTNAWSGCMNTKFLNYYKSKWTYCLGFVFAASEFEGVGKGSGWSVCFTLWRYGAPEDPERNRRVEMCLLKYDNGYILPLGENTAIISERANMINQWIRDVRRRDPVRPSVNVVPLSNAMTVSNKPRDRLRMPVNAIGYFLSSTNAIKQNHDQVYLLSSVRGSGHGQPVLLLDERPDEPLSAYKHILAVSVTFYVRRCILPKTNELWKCWHYDYARPNTSLESDMHFLRWALNCVPFVLFDPQRSLQASMRNVCFRDELYTVRNHWLPFTWEQMYEMADEIGWMEMIDDLRAHPRTGCIAKLLHEQDAALFTEARELLVAALCVWKETIPCRYRRYQDPDVVDKQLSNWDCSWWQIRNVCTKSQRDRITAAWSALRARLYRGINEFGFLPELPPLRCLADMEAHANDEEYGGDELDTPSPSSDDSKRSSAASSPHPKRLKESDD